MVLCAAFLAFTNPRIVGDWTLVLRQGEGNSHLRLGKDRRFVLSTPNQYRPTPSIAGPYEIARTPSGEILVRCLFKETLATSGVPRQPWRGEAKKLEVRFLPEVPALVVDEERAYLPLRDFPAALRRLAVWRAKPRA